MSFSKISTVAGLMALASKVAAHGTVTGMVADGIYYEGYAASFQFMQTQPKVVGWSIPEDLGNGFIAPSAYATSDIICHLGATNAKVSAPVKAGGIVELQWTAWPESHHGPVIDYLANCGGDCSTVDKTTLEWFKIDGVGLLDDTTVPGTWASDTLIANNNSWSVTIPTDIASGNYVLRHEIIALHSAGTVDGAQNYPQCVNLQISGSGTATPSGTLGTALYGENDAGIVVNIYSSLASYEVPGPALYSGAISMSQTQQPAATAVASGIAGSGNAVAASTTAASSAASSSVASVAVSSSAQATVTRAPTSPPYSNNTISTSSKKSKSACKSKSASSSATTPVAIISTSTAVNVGAVQTSSSASLLTTSAASVTIATSVVSTPTSVASGASATGSTSSGSSGSNSGSSSSGSTTSAATIPKGTTLNTLLSWISSFYDSFKGTSYDESTVMTRRHARDLSA